MSLYKVTDTELTSVASAIRTKGGTSASLIFPAGFVSAIEDIPTGGGNVIVSEDAPSSDVGSDGQFYIQVTTISVISYGIEITVAARNTDYSFNYWGARDIDFVFTDGTDEYHLRDFTGATAQWAAGNGSYSTQNGVIDGNTGNYYEHNDLPAWYKISAQVPSGYALKKVRVCGRNDSWGDFWRTFTVGQLSGDKSFLNTLISESDLVFSDWDTSSRSAYTEFELSAPSEPIQINVYKLYLKQAGEWLLVAN